MSEEVNQVWGGKKTFQAEIVACAKLLMCKGQLIWKFEIRPMRMMWQEQV